MPWYHCSTWAPALSLQQNVVGSWEMGTAECNLCFKEVLSFSFIPPWPLILKLAGECDFPAWPIALPGSELFSVALGILHPVPTQALFRLFLHVEIFTSVKLDVFKRGVCGRSIHQY